MMQIIKYSAFNILLILVCVVALGILVNKISSGIQEKMFGIREKHRNCY